MAELEWRRARASSDRSGRLNDDNSIDLTMRERFALLALRRVFDVFEHTPLHDDVRSVYAKITAGFPAAAYL